MHAGLARILDLIRVNPQDTLLVDRFLILAADLQDAEKADVTLSLSEALLRKNPRRSIELAHMVFKARPEETLPIELMVEGLENLGRYGKATVLRQHLEKVRKAKETNPGEAKRVVQESVAAIDRELLLLVSGQGNKLKTPEDLPAKSDQVLASPKKSIEPVSQTPVRPLAGGLDDDFRLSLSPAAKIPANQELSKKTQEDIPTFDVLLSPSIPFSIEHFEKDQGQLNQLMPDSSPQQSVLGEMNIGFIPSEHIDTVSEFNILADANEDLRNASSLSKVTHLENASNFAPPEAIVNELSLDERQSISSDVHLSSLKYEAQGVPSLLLHDEEFLSQNDEGKIEKSRKADLHTKVEVKEKVLSFNDLTSHAKPGFEFPADPMGQVRRYVAARDWEALWVLLQGVWPNGGSGEIVRLAKEMRIENIDVRFFGWWLDCLIADHRARQAVAHAVKVLKEKPYMAIAKAIFPRLKRCESILKLNNLNWKEEDGVMQLLDLMRGDQIYSLSSQVVLNNKKSA